jgi:diaminopimelate epimerase
VTDSFPFLKGHGTENDFVLLPDPDGTVHGALGPELVAALCDRRAGIGADGVMRVVRCEAYDDPAAVAARGQAAATGSGCSPATSPTIRASPPRLR